MMSRAELSSRGASLIWPVLFLHQGCPFWFPREAELVVDDNGLDYFHNPGKAAMAAAVAGCKGEPPPVLTGRLVVRHGWPWARRTAELSVFRALPRGNWRFMTGDWTPGTVVEGLEDRIRDNRLIGLAMRQQLEARHG